MKTKLKWNLVLVTVLAAVGWAGCDPKPSPSPSERVEALQRKEAAAFARLGSDTNRVVNELEVYQLLVRAGVNNLTNRALGDRAWECPPERWFTGEYSMKLHEFFGRLNVSFRADTFDCDDFARGAAFYAQVLHRGDAGRVKGTALAVGELVYTAEQTPNGGPAGRHAINFAVVLGADGAKRLVFYEPQLRLPLTLSRREVESITYWRL